MNHASEHDFTLVLAEPLELTDDISDRLFAAGCDDATVSQRGGRLFMQFSRAAASLKDAILSAIADVRKAAIGTDVLRVDDCHLVSQADIARRIDRSRQLVNQLINGQRGPGDFPPPACAQPEQQPLWNWCEVAAWLCRYDMLRAEILRDAEEVEIINNALEMRRQRKNLPELTREIIEAVGA